MKAQNEILGSVAFATQYAKIKSDGTREDRKSTRLNSSH